MISPLLLGEKRVSDAGEGEPLVSVKGSASPPPVTADNGRSPSLKTLALGG